jgi:hypothetical protein
MLKKLWVVKSPRYGPYYKQANVLAPTKEQAIVLFLMKIDPEIYPDQDTARKFKHICLALPVLNVYVDR